MKYLLLIYAGENAISDAEREKCYGESTKLCHELSEKGQFLGANPLQPVSTATTVRMREGKRFITDGPFAETREQLGGFYMIECGDLDEAVRWAAQVPEAQHGSIEVRPVMDYEGMSS